MAYSNNLYYKQAAPKKNARVKQLLVLVSTIVIGMLLSVYVNA
jgi:hypothetical protein